MIHSAPGLDRTEEMPFKRADFILGRALLADNQSEHGQGFRTQM
jgi:hypothetical protein